MTSTGPDLISALLAKSAALHDHLCPRQVLGVRMGLLGGKLLDVPVPTTDKRLFVVMECDGCGADGVSVATNCWVGRRTMRIEDYGKMAATFVDMKHGDAFRVWPHPDARTAAVGHTGDAEDRWEAMLTGYQTMSDEKLLVWAPVRLRFNLAEHISDPDRRAVCAECGEEVRNGREVVRGGIALCSACASGRYYRTNSDP